MATVCGCTPNPPALIPLHCNTQEKPTGGEAFMVKHCSVQVTDITDIAEWQTLILAGNVIGFPFSKFSRPKGETVLRKDGLGNDRLCSVGPFKLTIDDSDCPYDPNTTAPSVSSPVHAWMKELRENGGSYEVAWMHPDGSVYGWYRISMCDLMQQGSENGKEVLSFMGDIVFNTESAFEEPTPQAILPTLRSLFLA